MEINPGKTSSPAFRSFLLNTERNCRPKQGFVLAEVLVVSVIVAILAAVAIPVYTGYVTQQRKEVVKNIAETAAVSANIWYRKNGTVPDSSKLGLFLTNSSKYRLQVVDPYIKVQDVSVTPNVRDSALFH